MPSRRRDYIPASLPESSRKARLSVITGTDAPAILGVSRWRTAFDVFAEKTGTSEPVETNAAMEWGNRLEPLVRWKYEEQTGRKLKKPAKMLRSDAYPWMGGHVDGLDDEVVFEAKTDRYGEGFGESGSDVVPIDYRVQLLHYLALTGRRRGELAVLIGGSDFRTYTIEADAELLADLAEEERRWYQKHLVEGEPPLLDGSKAATAWLRRRHPLDSGEELVALPHHYAALAAVVAAERYADDAERTKELAHQLLMETMGDASRLLAPGLKVSWTTADRRTVDWKAMVAEYERRINELYAIHDELLDHELFTTTKSIRTLRVTVGSEAETAALGEPADLSLPVPEERPLAQAVAGSDTKEKE